MTDNDTIPVIDMHSAREEAHRMGYEQYRGMDTHDYDSKEEFTTAHFKESAQWANVTAPNLRALAGCGDSGYGTYQESRTVVVIEDFGFTHWIGKEEEVSSDWVFNQLVEEWDNGAFEAFQEAYDK